MHFAIILKLRFTVFPAWDLSQYLFIVFATKIAVLGDRGNACCCSSYDQNKFIIQKWRAAFHDEGDDRSESDTRLVVGLLMGKAALKNTTLWLYYARKAFSLGTRSGTPFQLYSSYTPHRWCCSKSVPIGELFIDLMIKFDGNFYGLAISKHLMLLTVFTIHQHGTKPLKTFKS